MYCTKVFLVTLFFSLAKSQPVDLSAEWNINDDFSLSNELEESIGNQIATLPNTLGFIVIHQGKIVSENYYNSNDENEINIWSVTKSFISTLVGQAVDMNLIEDPDSSISFFFPEYDIDYLRQISLHNVLTMTTGYSDDFENFWSYDFPEWINQTTENLLSMGHSSPGSFFYNNSACHINSHIIFYKTEMKPLEFGNSYLFPQLGIDNPNWDDGYQNINDGSSSLYLNLRDMVKLGQLYLQDGLSGSEQIISSEWVERATNVQTGTENYGYLWWLHDNEGTSYSARGFGGQVIAVYPDYELVIGAQSDIFGSDDINSHSNLLNDRINSIATIFEGYQYHDDSNVQSPSSFKLYSNYPNPFNPLTTIEYFLPKKEFVSITVYDILGNVVNNLVNENQNSGNQTVSWNAKNNFGDYMSAGMYVYTIQAGEFKATKKMVLLK